MPILTAVGERYIHPSVGDLPSRREELETNRFDYTIKIQKSKTKFTKTRNIQNFTSRFRSSIAKNPTATQTNAAETHYLDPRSIKQKNTNPRRRWKTASNSKERLPYWPITLRVHSSRPLQEIRPPEAAGSNSGKAKLPLLHYSNQIGREEISPLLSVTANSNISCASLSSFNFGAIKDVTVSQLKADSSWRYHSS